MKKTELRTLLTLTICISVVTQGVAAWDTPIPPVIKSPQTLTGAVLCSPESQVDRNTTQFKMSDGKPINVALLGCDFPAEADKNPVGPKDLAGTTAYVLVRTGTSPIPTQTISEPPTLPTNSTPSKPKPTGWLAKSTQDQSYGYVYVYSQPDNAWVALNFVAVTAGLAWMVDPSRWPAHGPEDAAMIQAMQKGVEAAAAQHLGLYAILDNPKTVAFEDVVQLKDNIGNYWFPDSVRKQLEAVLSTLAAAGEFSGMP